MDDFFDAMDNQGNDQTNAAEAPKQEEYGFQEDSDDDGVQAIPLGNGGDIQESQNDNSNAIENEETLNIEEKQDNDKKEEDEEDKEQEETFLSVWKKQRQTVLETRRQKEKELLAELQEKGRETIEKFHEERQEKIKNRKDENIKKEKNIREDLDSVFKNGTIWEQVGRMVDLKEIKNKNSQEAERMRTLLIYLKNQKK